MAGYPPLQLMVDSLDLVNSELSALANLTVAVSNYGALNATLSLSLSPSLTLTLTQL